MTEARRLPDVSYVLPIKQRVPDTDHDLALYLAWLGERLEVIIVDGSSTEVFVENDARSEETEMPAARQVDAVREELAALRSELREFSERLATGASVPPSVR